MRTRIGNASRSDRAARLMIWQTNEADAQLVQLYFQTQEEMSSAVIVMRSISSTARITRRR